jgi:hypothetical protein
LSEKRRARWWTSDSTNSALGSAFRFVGSTFSLELLIAGHFTDAFFDRSLSLVGCAFNTIRDATKP